jgi:hypothetical protein
MRLQATVDFMLSYGLALIIIVIAIAVIYKVSVLNAAILPSTCTPNAGFSCSQFSINTTGAVSIAISQATGGPITIHGIACSTSANTTGTKPESGNIHVVANSAFYPYNSYPNNALVTGITMYSGSTTVLTAYCYSGPGIATGSLGSSFLGYLWINYTLQGYGTIISQAATFSTKYT